MYKNVNQYGGFKKKNKKIKKEFSNKNYNYSY
jgi:hypothetical protein